jgi:hypothetical protein
MLTLVCSALFDQDTIKQTMIDTTVSQNLFTLKKTFQGVEGLAAGLNSNIQVSAPLLLSVPAHLVYLDWN